MGLFGKKKLSRDEIIAGAVAVNDEDAQDKKEEDVYLGNPKLDIELTKIKAKLESVSEIRNMVNERFSRVSEQVGELRGMITDMNKTVSKVEVGSTKAIDLVESVQPEKLMIEVRKLEGKTEALKAGIDSNDARMQDVLSEIKEMRQKINFFKGIEQVTKMNEEVKKEIAEIKKVEVNIERHADKVDSIFIEVNKKTAEFETFNETVKDLNTTIKSIESDFDKIKVKTENKADKKEVTKLLSKFNEFEKHTGRIIELLDEKTRINEKDMEKRFQKLRLELENQLKVKIDEEKVKSEKPKQEKHFFKKMFQKKNKEEDDVETSLNDEISEVTKNNDSEL